MEKKGRLRKGVGLVQGRKRNTKETEGGKNPNELCSIFIENER